MPLFLLYEWMRSLARKDHKGGPLILIYSQVLWDEVWQRPQQYAWRASQEYAVIYCAPVQPHNIMVPGMKWRPRQYIAANGRNLLVLSPLIFAGHFKSRWINRVNCWIVARYIKLSVHPNHDVRLLTNTPFAVPVIESAFFQKNQRCDTLSRIVYDVIDDFTAFEWAPAFSRVLERRLREVADQILTGTEALAQAYPDSTFIPCGVDYELFAKSAPLPPDIADIQKPILGYFGTISERIDFDLIQELSIRLSHANIVFVGPCHLPPNQLPQGSNIFYLGLKTHAQLPAYAKAFNVALIPFKISPATMVLNPVKTLEYMASRLPVVATRLPDLENFYSDVLYLADNHEDFINLVQQALAMLDVERLDRGIELAKQASWVSMTEKINKSLFPNGNESIGPLSESRKS